MQKYKIKISYVIIALLMAFAVFFANRSVQGPMIQADEGVTVANAAAIAGFPNDMAGSHHAGYSILIAPAFWIGDTPDGVWTAIKAINAVLYALIILGLWLIAKHISPTTTSRKRFAAVILISLYPMWVVMAGYSFAQIAFVPVFIFTFLMYLRAIRGGHGSWIVLGLFSGFLYWVHPTGVAPYIALCISAAYITWHRRNYASFGLLLITMIAMVLIYKLGFTPWLHAHMDISGIGPTRHYPSPLKLVMAFKSLDSMMTVFVRIIGQFFYLTIGSIGLIWLGLFTLTGKALRSPIPKESDELLRDRAIAIFSWLSLIGIIVLPALMRATMPFTSTNRIDQWMDGRYVEGVIAPILLIGALTISSRKRVLGIIAIAVFSASVLALSNVLDNYEGLARFNITAFWQALWLLEYGIWVWLATGCALIVLVAALPRKVGMILIALIFLISSSRQISWHARASNNVSLRWASALSIRDQFAPGTCVGFDHSTINGYNEHVYWFDFGLILFDYRLRRFRFGYWRNRCDGPLFTYEKNLDIRSAEVYPITSIRNPGPVAWMKGSPPKESYPIIISNKSPSLALINALGPGWNNMERAHIWSGAEALLKLPVPEICRADACSAILTLNAFGASETRPVEVILKTGSEEVPLVLPFVLRDSSRYKITVPLDGSRAISPLSIIVPDATSPSKLQGTDDTRVLGVALHSIELVTPKTDLKDSYPIIVSDTSLSAALTDALGPGWNDPEENSVWSGADALLQLPVPKECKSGGCSAILTLNAYGASETRPVEIILKTGSKDAPLLPPYVIRSPSPQKITVPLNANRAISHITIKVPDATSPNALQGIPDTRVLGVALHSVELHIPETNLKDSYPIIVSNTEPSSALTSALGPGWNALERDYVWSGADALLQLPVPDECRSGECSAILTLRAYHASKKRPVEVIFKTSSEDTPKLPPYIIRSPLPQKIVVPLNTSQAISYLTINVPDATSPSALQGIDDTRVLGVALHAIELKIHSTNPNNAYPMIMSDIEPSLTITGALGPGWDTLEREHVWSGAEALLKLPVPDKCRSGGCSAILTLRAYGASKERPVEVIFKTGPDDALLLPPFVARSPSNYRISVPLSGSQAISPLFIKVPDARSPSALQGFSDTRVLGVALQSIELVTPKTELLDSYPMIVSDIEPSVALTDALGPGWNALERNIVWSGAEALLQLPVPKECRSGGCSAALTLKAYGASKKRPVKIIFETGKDTPKLPPYVIRNPLPQKINVPLSGSRAISHITIKVPDATTPSALHGIDDTRVLGIGLYSIKLKFPKTNKNNATINKTYNPDL